MALLSQYQSFLTTSNPVTLAHDAALHYVPTLTTVKEPSNIVKHLAEQQKTMKKKTEKVLSSIESANAVFLEVETMIEFVNGGGAYLPGFDDNLVADRVVTFPILHVVHFDANGKIQQIRIHWDQACLLKAIEVIGASGKNWPIKEGAAQVKLISTSAKASASPPSVEATTKQMGGVTITSKPTKKLSHPTNDPHTSLNLFGPSDSGNENSYSNEARIAPRGSLKPAQRDWEELFATSNPESKPAANRSASPSKENRTPIAPKAGSSKNFQPSRLFDVEEKRPTTPGSPSKTSPEKGQGYIKTHPTKYNHFDFYDGHDEPAQPASKPRPKTKHQSQWDFEDFVTPAKPVPSRNYGQDKKNFTIGEDDNAESQGSPVRRGNMPQPRPDSRSNFELQDDGESPENRKSGHPRGPGNILASANLYVNHMIGDEGAEGGEDAAAEDAGAAARPRPATATSLKDRSKDFAPHFAMTDDPTVGDEPASKPSESTEASNDHSTSGKPTGNQPLATVTNLKDRGRDFGPHFSMTDASPGGPSTSADAHNRPGLVQNRSKAARTTEAQWSATDESPTKPHGSSQPLETDAATTLTGHTDKENAGIKAVGDGMGGRKGAGRSWAFGEDSEEEMKGLKVGKAGENGRAPVRGKGAASRQGAEDAVGGGARPGGGGFWDF